MPEPEKQEQEIQRYSFYVTPGSPGAALPSMRHPDAGMDPEPDGRYEVISAAAYRDLHAALLREREEHEAWVKKERRRADRFLARATRAEDEERALDGSLTALTEKIEKLARVFVEERDGSSDHSEFIGAVDRFFNGVRSLLSASPVMGEETGTDEERGFRPDLVSVEGAAEARWATASAERLYTLLGAIDTRDGSNLALLIQAAREGHERSHPDMGEINAWDEFDARLSKFTLDPPKRPAKVVLSDDQLFYAADRFVDGWIELPEGDRRILEDALDSVFDQAQDFDPANETRRSESEADKPPVPAPPVEIGQCPEAEGHDFSLVTPANLDRFRKWGEFIGQFTVEMGDLEVPWTKEDWFLLNLLSGRVEGNERGWLKRSLDAADERIKDRPEYLKPEGYREDEKETDEAGLVPGEVADADLEGRVEAFAAEYQRWAETYDQNPGLQPEARQVFWNVSNGLRDVLRGER